MLLHKSLLSAFAKQLLGLHLVCNGQLAGSVAGAV